MIGQNIAYYRKLQNIKQKDLAKAIDTTTGFISMLETGKSTISEEKLLKVAEFLKVDIELLRNGDMTSRLINKISDLTTRDLILWSKLTNDEIELIFTEYLQHKKPNCFSIFNRYKNGFIGETQIDLTYYLLERKNKENKSFPLYDLISISNKEEEILANNERYYTDLNNLISLVNRIVKEKDTVMAQLDLLEKLDDEI